jgi:hypothetical protein
VDFIERKWLPYVINRDGHLDRHYYELCVLWELRNALRAGNVWLAFSRRYANPESYLIPKADWPARRPEVCQQVQLPDDNTTRFTEREHELAELLTRVEALHALREFLFFANKGTIRRKQEEDQANQAGCLNLLTNAVVAWNTVYMAAAIEQLRADGYAVRDEDIAHLSPARYEHINPYGKYRFDIDLRARQLRPLRPA